MGSAKSAPRCGYIYIYLSEYWNNSNAAFPTFVPWRPRRYSGDCQEHDILYGSGVLPLFPFQKDGTSKDCRQRATLVCGERRLKATVRNSSPFVGYQTDANRYLQLRSTSRFHAIRGYLIFFHRLARSLSLSDGVKNSCNLESGEASAKYRDMFDQSR